MLEFANHVVAFVAFIAIVLLIVGLATMADKALEDHLDGW